MMASIVLNYVQNFWPFSYFKFDDLRASDSLVRKLPIPENTKRFVYAVQEPQSGAVIYVLCVQNLSERSALDAECLIRTVKPDAVVAQVGPSISVNDSEIASEDCSSSRSNYKFDGKDRSVDEYPLPTSSFEVIKRCFLHKIDREKYDNIAGNLVMKEIFGIGFNGHFLSAKKAAEEVGASFLLLDSPFVKCNGDGTCSLEMKQQVEGDELGNKVHTLGIQPKGLVTWTGTSIISMVPWRFSTLTDVQFQMVKTLPLQLIDSASVRKVDSDNVLPRDDYEAPQFSQSIYPLLVDLHDVFIDIPYMGRALAHAQKMLCDINKGEVVDTKLLSEVFVFRIAVEGLRIALNYASRLPLKTLGNLPSSCDFFDLPIQDKSHAIVAHSVRSQTSRFKSIVALVDANGLAGFRKHWNTPIPVEVEDMVEQLVATCENDQKIQIDGGRKLLLSEKPMVAFGAGVTAVLGASSLSKVGPASTFVKILTFKVPASLKLMITQTNKIVALTFGKFAPSTVTAPGVASGVKTSIYKAASSANKIRAVAHSVIASAEKTSISAMRTAFYEIMRRRRVRPIGFLPWATLGFSVATCAGLLVYGDGIECAIESAPAAPSIACLGRGVENLHQASQAIRQAESSRIQKSIESLLHRFRKLKVQ